MDFPGLTFLDPFQLPIFQQIPQSMISVMVSALATSLLIGGYALGQRKMRPQARSGASELSDENCDFLIMGSNLKALTAPARALLDNIGVRKTRLAAIKSHLAADCPGIGTDIQNLILEGREFRHHCVRGNGSEVEIIGEPRGNSVFLSIRPASEQARALQRAESALHAARSENGFLREILDRSPVMAWCRAPDDSITWANEVYRANFDNTGTDLPDHRIPNAFGHVLEEVPLTSRGSELRRRVSVTSRTDEEPHWYEVVQCSGADGATFGYAIEADELVGAEKSLRRFVETLTETFAHLPIGLAVFDKNRRLGLFNPALTELVKIDAVWLAGRPSLRDFLERLRETRQMPEQKDFASWRRKLSQLEEGARDGTYEENWVLPSGKVFRVTGRPHPQGALAFLFEDISTSVMLERKFRSELELGQATLDHLNEAVAVFDASGSLSIVNTAFEELWEIDQSDRLQGPGISDMTRIWSEKCEKSTVWSKISEFATGGQVRTSWSGNIRMMTGRDLQVFLAPMPDASSLVLFRDGDRGCVTTIEDGTAPVTSLAFLSDIAFEEIQSPVRSALTRLMSAIPSAQNADAYQSLNAAVRDLKGGLDRSREIQDLAHAAVSANSDPVAALRRAMEARGLTLEVSPESVMPDSRLRGLAMLTGLAAAEMADTGAAVSLSIQMASESSGWILTAATAMKGSTAEIRGPGATLCGRVVEAAGGSVRMVPQNGVFTVTATLPVQLERDVPPRSLPSLSA